MSFRNSQIGSALLLKCPKCRTGEIFIDRNPYNLSALGKMPTNCPNCNLKIFPEAGFYYGAMWISYLIGIIMSVLIICVSLFVFKIEIHWAFGIFILFHIVFSPYLFKFSRTLWLSFYVNQHRDI